MRPRILVVDDDDSDARLMIRRLENDGVEVDFERVADERTLRGILTERQWDVALADYNIPGFSGLEAIRIISELAPDTPVITVSGAIDEETAVATLTAGAVDYVLKDNLTRLAPAVEQALAGAAARRDLRRAAEDARTSQFVLDHSSFPIALLAEDGTVVYANQSSLTLAGVPAERFVGRKVWEVDAKEDPEHWASLWQTVRDRGTVQIERAAVYPDGVDRDLEITMNYMQREGVPTVVTYTRDVSEARRAEVALRESEARFSAFGRHLPGYLYMYDEAGRYIYTNDRVLHEGDIPPADWIGKTPMELWPTKDAAIEADAVHRAFGGEVVDTVQTWEGPTRVEHLHSLFFPIRREDRPPLVGGVSIDVSALVTAEDELRRTAEQLRETAGHLRETLEGTVLAMGQIVETRDPYTAGHERRVAELAVAIARELGMDENDVEGLRIAAVIHDIGKIAVPAEILTKPGRLSAAEFRLIMQHAQVGHDILAGIRFEHPVAEVVLQHHERLDGSGYPNGLTTDILPEARVLMVADVVEAMSSHRPYRPTLGSAAALAEIEQGAGRLYDPDAVAACLRLMRDKGFEFSA